MHYVVLVTFVVLVIVAIKALTQKEVRLRGALAVIVLVAVPAITLYWLTVQDNPWYNGKRAVEWSRQLQDWRSDAEAAEAAEALETIGDGGLAALSFAVESADPRVSKRAADIIAGICSRSKGFSHRYQVTFKYLLKAMKGAKDASVRIHIAGALPRCGPVARNEAVDKALKALAREDPDPSVRSAATRALDEIEALPKSDK